MAKLVIDHIENIELDSKNPPLKNMHAFNCLPHGLLMLANTVRAEEIAVANQLGGHTVFMFVGFKNDNTITCCFHWFSISITNYTRLIALVDLMNKNGWTSANIADPANHKTVKNHCTEYVKRVIPEVYTYRNKIAAHFSITDPFRNDNLGTLELSIMNQVAYMKPYFTVGGFRLPKINQETEIPKWALTEVYEKISQRYWPKIKLNKIETK